MARGRWEIGNCAGHHFPEGGDLTVHYWVTTPRGRTRILTVVCGFRDTPDGRRKVILDRYLQDPPLGSIRADN